MIWLDIQKNILETCERIIKFAPHLQNHTRKKLINRLHSICQKSEDAYSSFLNRLAPIKKIIWAEKNIN